MTRMLLVLVGSSALTLFAPAPGAAIGGGYVAAFSSAPSDNLHRSLYPANVDCRDFDKTGRLVWRLRDRSEVDLGNWGAAFPITGAIERGVFVSNGIDLFDVLESKCGSRI